MKDDRELIILVDENAASQSAANQSLAEQYTVFTAASAEKLSALLEEVTPDLILLDITKPELNGNEIIVRLAADPKTREIPVVLLTAGAGDALAGLSLGASDYIEKPVSPPLLHKRVALQLLLKARKESIVRLQSELREQADAKNRYDIELQNTLLHTMAELVEYRDDITGGHIERVQGYLAVLLDALRRSGLYHEEVSKWDTDLVLQSSQLHDIGKIAVRDSILLKPGKLTDDEFSQIKRHTVFGEKIIARVRENTADHAFLEYARVFISAHHENWDGSGYPNGLKGDAIPLLGRVMALVDVYDALVSERPYKKPFTHDEAVGIMRKGSGTQFDPALLDIFLSCEKELASVASQAAC